MFKQYQHALLGVRYLCTQRYTGRQLAIAAAITLLLAGARTPSLAGTAFAATPPVKITGVYAGTGSAKVTFAMVSGAADYRIYDVANPGTVKYAGIWHLTADYGYLFATKKSGNVQFPLVQIPVGSGGGVATVDTPATEIEWNGLTPGVPVTLVVEAVRQKGPFSAGNVASIRNAAQFPGSQNPHSMLGSNEGLTGDGKVSINGQGSSSSLPVVIAQSAPFVVTATGAPALPSGQDAGQVVFDSFDGESAMPMLVGTVDPVGGTAEYNLMTMAVNWDVTLHKADTNLSMPMIDRGHLMDVLYDGGTPNTNQPLHVSHGSMSFSPMQTADISNGQILHVTFEVDSHTDNRRWVSIALSPANDPIVDFYPTEAAVNNSDQAMILNIYSDHPSMTVYYGPSAPGNPIPTGDTIIGPAGQADNYAARPVQNYQFGHGLDNRSRFDLFISQTHFALYEDGINMSEYDIPAGLPFSNPKVYFNHYVYHTDLEMQELADYAPWEKYWMTDTRYSDERHWDNMGFEVLPAGADWLTMGARIEMPAASMVRYTK